MTHKKLYRSDTDKVFAGICGGLAEFFDIDSVLLRLLWLLIVVFTGFVPGVIAYIFAILIIPKKPTNLN
ncbi:MAG: PspC domain-containing protein [Candidatus Zambryskibacteria bacterium RIFCSPHIGHO2_01_FULL_49_18]|uniref:PspC domain-containing protein n=2 Tax=Candidatus Zambryskiibacteriota TaxID=1817925 RepID=A0A1G2T1W9_9BACT|nr:MAG: PspC domain-containing protein [Candidatus Zambryskibacteria bacterium RIFCSPHIGHO2_01_FULL_49_18]OHB06156.1 MAG: PspC domain-containing protein [Candidatus Zambryskibacteria bacterium RIFCSPLOWO2_01_FULL_47_14]